MRNRPSRCADPSHAGKTEARSGEALSSVAAPTDRRQSGDRRGLRSSQRLRRRRDPRRLRGVAPSAIDARGRLDLGQVGVQRGKVPGARGSLRRGRLRNRSRGAACGGDVSGLPLSIPGRRRAATESRQRSPDAAGTRHPGARAVPGYAVRGDGAIGRERRRGAPSSTPPPLPPSAAEPPPGSCP